MGGSYHTWGGAATQASRDRLRDCKGPDQEEDLGASPHPAADKPCDLGKVPKPSELIFYFQNKGGFPLKGSKSSLGHATLNTPDPVCLGS